VSQPPNVLIYFIDELRADVLGCDGHPFVQTPTIDRIAAQGVRFERAISNCPLCMPARNCFYTGQYPSRHGVMFNELPEGVSEQHPPDYAFGDVLQSAGYRQIINIGKHHTGLPAERSGFTHAEGVRDQLGAGATRPPRGLDPQRHELIVSPGDGPNVILAGVYPTDGRESEAHQVADRTIEQLDALAASDEPWLLRASFDTPHTPVLPPEPFASMYRDAVADWQPDRGELDRRAPLLRRWHRFRGWDRFTDDQLRWIRAAYFGLTTYLDHQIARIERALAERGLDENLLTIFIADHGSSIGDHGCQVKGPFDTDDIARVPLLVRQPGRIEPGVHEPMVQLIDVLPTLGELVGAAVPESVQGRSFAGALRGDAGFGHEAVFAEGTFPLIHEGVRESIRTDDYLLTRYPALDEMELFDLEADPAQTRNVAADRPDIVQDLSGRLDAWRADHPLPPTLTPTGTSP